MNIQIDLPDCIKDETPEDIIAGVKLFYETMCSKVGFSIYADIGANHDRLREAFGEFIKIADLRKTRPHIQYEDPEYDLYHLEDRLDEFLAEYRLFQTSPESDENEDDNDT